MWCGYVRVSTETRRARNDGSKAKAKAVAWWDARIKDAVQVYNKTAGR
jgi:hypothetical protein